MDHPAPLADIGIILGMALGVTWLFRILRAPSILGYLFTGVIIGPAGLELVSAEEVEFIAEIGLVLLLFTIGLELSPAPLMRMGRSLFIAFALQSGITAALAMLVVGAILPLSLTGLFVVAVAVALSSTAITLKQLNDRGEIDTLNGMICTGILLLQDVLVIVVMLFLPLFAAGEGGGSSVGQAFGQLALGLAAMGTAVYLVRKAMPYVLDYMVRPGGREFLALFSVVMACGGAWLASWLGWSPALGACIAGLLLADADERHQMVADILPFRDVFNAFFFISLGMLVNVEAGVTYALPLTAFILLTIGLKIVLTYIAVRGGGWGIRPALTVGLAMCTVSEFGYVLVREALELQVLDAQWGEVVIVYIFCTMLIGTLVTPGLRPFSGKIATLVARIDPRDLAVEDRRTERRYKNHVIIVGYGVTGQNLKRVLEGTRIPYCIIEMNRRLVADAQAQDAHIVIGDASRLPILRHAGIDDAETLVVAINDPEAAKRVISQARSIRPDLYIVVRTRYTTDIDILYRLGANQVIAEDFESSIEISAHVLRELNIPDNIVEGQIAAIRAGRYAMLRGRPTEHQASEELMQILQLTVTRSHYLTAQSEAAGKTIAELDLRARTGVTIIAVVRDGQPITSPPGDMDLHAGDVLVLVGAHEQLEKAKACLDKEPEPRSARS